MTVHCLELRRGVALGIADRIARGLARRGGAWFFALCLAVWASGAAGADPMPTSRTTSVPSAAPSTATAIGADHRLLAKLPPVARGGRIAPGDCLGTVFQFVNEMSQTQVFTLLDKIGVYLILVV